MRTEASSLEKVAELSDWSSDFESLNPDEFGADQIAVIGNLLTCNAADCDELRIVPGDLEEIADYRPIAIHTDTDPDRVVLVKAENEEFIAVAVYWHWLHTERESQQLPVIPPIMVDRFPGASSHPGGSLQWTYVANNTVSERSATLFVNNSSTVAAVDEEVGTPDTWNVHGDVYVDGDGILYAYAKVVICSNTKMYTQYMGGDDIDGGNELQSDTTEGYIIGVVIGGVFAIMVTALVVWATIDS